MRKAKPKIISIRVETTRLIVHLIIYITHIRNHIYWWNNIDLYYNISAKKKKFGTTVQESVDRIGTIPLGGINIEKLSVSHLTSALLDLFGSSTESFSRPVLSSICLN